MLILTELRLRAVIVKCHFQDENNSLTDGCEPVTNDVHGPVIATMPVNKSARKQIHRKQTGIFNFDFIQSVASTGTLLTTEADV